jgi:hypothetical protein
VNCSSIFIEKLVNVVVLTLPIIEVHLDPFENVRKNDVNEYVAASSNHGGDQRLQVKSVKNVLCVKFFLVNILKSFSQNLCQLIKIRLGVKLALFRLTSRIFAVAGG